MVSQQVKAESYDGVVDNLVTQFSSALECFRELVQNSIDAGSPQVEVWMEFEPGAGHQGVIAIHVDDFGEGMDEAVIDEQFTRLFASSKDQDLTKIGKFGIGFVSVFALEPKAVLVHTGRGGEYWEVLFHEDRSFSKTEVDNPVEGTQITLFLEGEYHRYQELVEQIPATLRYWCGHSEVELTFEDRSGDDPYALPEVLNEAFDVVGECVQRVEHQGTEIVLGYNERPHYGFFNRGLTLAQSDIGEEVLAGWAERFEYISFKIKSRYLEHTLSRDSVVQDEQYAKAMGLLKEAADGVLLAGLVSELERLAGAEGLSVAELHRYGRLMRFLAKEPVSEVVQYRERPILRTLHGGAMSLQQGWEQIRRSGRLLMSDGPTEFTKYLWEQEIPVLLGAARGSAMGMGGLRELLVSALSQIAQFTAKGAMWSIVDQVKRLVGDDGISLERRIFDALSTPEEAYLPVVLTERVDQETMRLVIHAQALLREAKLGFRRLEVGKIDGRSGEVPLFVVAPKIGPLMGRPPRGFGPGQGMVEAVVNEAHPHFELIRELVADDPVMAAYLLARALLLSEDYELMASSQFLELSLSKMELRSS